MTIGGQLLLHDALKPPWRPKIALHKNNRMRLPGPKVMMTADELREHFAEGHRQEVETVTETRYIPRQPEYEAELESALDTTRDELEAVKYKVRFHNKPRKPSPTIGLPKGKVGDKSLNRGRIDAIKAETPCKDCGQYHRSYVMQFDHTGDDKVANISSMVSANVTWPVIEAEIAKCELVCANCHAERTHQRRAIVDDNGAVHDWIKVNG